MPDEPSSRRVTGGMIMESRGELINTITDAIVGNRTIALLRIIASLVGLAILVVALIWPGNALAEKAVKWAGVVLVALVLLSVAIQVAQKWFSHTSDQIAHAIVAKKYGYGYESLQVLAYLEPSSGGMRIHRRVRLNARATQQRVRHYLHSLGESPEGSDSMEIGGLHKIEPGYIDMTVEKVRELSYGDRMVIEVTFDPPLDAKKVAEYEIHEQFPPSAFATTAKEMADRDLQFEYLSWHINKPTKSLLLRVHIPTYLNPKKLDHDVWYGGYSRQRHGPEWNRMESCFKEREDNGQISIELDVPFPVLGLLYVLKWQYE
jgi:hypothetical protein